MRIDVYASGSSGNCYRVSDGTTALLLECGISKGQILEHIGYDISALSGVLVTHEHGDHAKSCKDMAKLGVDVYASIGTLTALELSGYRFKPIKAGKSFCIGTFDIYPFDTRHDCAEPLGFVLTSRTNKERLLFFTDTYYVRYVFGGVDIIMGECNYSLKTLSPDLPKSRKDRLFESHMSLEHFLKLLESYPNVSKIYLLHLSDENSDEEMFRREVMRKTGAQVYVC